MLASYFPDRGEKIRTYPARTIDIGQEMYGQISLVDENTTILVGFAGRRGREKADERIK